MLDFALSFAAVRTRTGWEKLVEGGVNWMRNHTPPPSAPMAARCNSVEMVQKKRFRGAGDEI